MGDGRGPGRGRCGSMDPAWYPPFWDMGRRKVMQGHEVRVAAFCGCWHPHAKAPPTSEQLVLRVVPCNRIFLK